MDCVVKPLNHVGDSYMVVAWLIEKNTYFFFCAQSQFLRICAPALWLLTFHNFTLSSYRVALCQHSGPDRPFPCESGSIYSLGLFWCKED